MSKNVLIQTQVAALDINSFVCNAKNTTGDIDNGNVLVRGALSTTAGEAEVFTTSTPVTGSLSNLWMAYTAPVVTSVIGGLELNLGLGDPRLYTNRQGKVFNIFKPQAGDIITMTDDGIQGGITALTVGQFAVAANNSLKLNPSASAIEGLTFKVLSKTDFISIGFERVTAVKLECVRN